MKFRKRHFLFVLPILLVYVTMKIIPMIITVVYSFGNLTANQQPFKFTFLQYTRLFQDQSFLNSIGVTAKLTILIVVGINVLAIFYAVLINDVKNKKLSTFYQVILFLPVVINPVAVSFIWRNMYSYYGLINNFLGQVGLESLQIGYLSDFKYVLFFVTIVEIWRATGFHAMILFSTLNAIPKSVYEAANIDGCSKFKEFWKITLPLMVPGITISVILSTIGALQQYSLVKILTDGGPRGATSTVAYNIVTRAFSQQQTSYASSMAIVLFITIITIAAVQNKYFSKNEVEF